MSDVIELTIEQPEVIELTIEVGQGPAGPGNGSGLEPIPSATILGNALGSPVIPQALTPSQARTVINCPAIDDDSQIIGVYAIDIFNGDPDPEFQRYSRIELIDYDLFINGIYHPSLLYIQANILNIIQASDLLNRTTDPQIPGRLWRDGTTVKISVGVTPFLPGLNFSYSQNSGYLALFEDI